MTENRRWARELIESYESSRPGVLELAELASLSARIEPELLRALRFRLASHLDVGAEADLWFSQLVQSRGSDGIAFSAEVAEILRDRLRQNAKRLDRAWQVTEMCHRTISPALLLEEKVTYLALSLGDKSGSFVDDTLAPVLVALAHEGRTGLAPWAARALPRLPREARSTRVAWMLSLAASRTIGNPFLQDGAPEDLMEEDLSGILPDLGETDLAVRRKGIGLELGDITGDGILIIRVSDTAPRLLEIQWLDSTENRREVVSIGSGATVRRQVGPGLVRLRTLAGAVYELLSPIEQPVLRRENLSAHIPPPDLEMQVQLLVENGRTRLMYLLHSPSGAAPFHFKQIAGPVLLGNSEEYYPRFMEKISAFSQGLDVDGSLLLQSEIAESLSSLGRQLWHELFPPELRYAYRAIRRNVRSWMIVSEEPWIPWGLVKPYDDDQTENLIDDDFLAFRFELTHWLTGTSVPARDIAVRRIVVVPNTTGLPTRESRALQELATTGAEVVTAPQVSFDELSDLLRAGAQVLHFQGHGSVASEQPNSGILPDDGRFLRPEDLLGPLASPIRRDQPLVFLETDASSFPSTGAWVDRWVRVCGVGALVLSFSRVKGRPAADFAESFYQALIRGATLGRAALEARLYLRTKRPGDPSAMTYTVYGHPNARVFFGPDKRSGFPINGIDGSTGLYLPDPDLEEIVPKPLLDPEKLREYRWWVERYGIDDPNR